MSLSEDIKNYALELGYSKVGFTTADSFPEYARELKARSELYDWYIDGPRHPILGAAPRNIMASAKSIISLVYDYARESFPDNLVGKIGRVYQARSLNTAENRINGVRPRLMREFLERNGCQVGKGIFIPERLTAARAGIVTYGKNCFVFADGIGSFVSLCSFVVDAELDYDKPTLEVKCPPKCTICLDACPTKAIYEPLKMNPRRCIAFNTFFTQDPPKRPDQPPSTFFNKDGMPGTTSHIPFDIREKMGTWIHGCDICQQVCPRNQERLKAKLPSCEFLEKIAQDFDIKKLLHMPEEFYVKRVQPLMSNYIQEKKYFQRNAAIAIGNMGDPVYIPALAQAMKDPEDLVRTYSAWALGKLGGDQSRKILTSCLAAERSDSVKREIQTSLKIIG